MRNVLGAAPGSAASLLGPSAPALTAVVKTGSTFGVLLVLLFRCYPKLAGNLNPDGNADSVHSGCYLTPTMTVDKPAYTPALG